MKKYIQCDECWRLIYEGSMDVFEIRVDGNTGLYCKQCIENELKFEWYYDSNGYNPRVMIDRNG